MDTPATDIHFMEQAIALATEAACKQEVPVGAVLVLDNIIIAKGYNQPIATPDPTAHAEIVALRAGAKYLNNYRLLNTTLYVTLEPCAMCVGAMLHARIKRLVFGAYDPKGGAIQSVIKLLDTKQFNHRIEYEGGILAPECGRLLSDFFKAKRLAPKNVH
ncbi:MAG: tRNA adenosine(34) deaminase TadA [Gammaproteobacteria bacterium]|nr:tRNA adenosine(34) deaminase TadA [Gammaproteobacteria bacterium]